MDKKILTIKWGKSRGVNTYGYAICTLYANGKKETTTKGGGYDMKGTVLGEYLKRYYLPRIMTLTGNYGSMDDGSGHYGLMYYHPTTSERSKVYKEGYGVSLDGGCGWNAMVSIAHAIGIEIEYMGDAFLLIDTQTV